jgi:hypothetical protein
VLERLRWGGAPATCVRCGSAGRCYFLRPKSGRARATRTGAPTGRRVWKCGACRGQFSVLVGTILQGTRVSVRTWLDALTESADAAAPIDAVDLVERHGLTRPAARLVSRRIALAFAAVSDGRLPDGRSPDGRSPDGRSPDGRSPDGRLPDGRLAAVLRLPIEDAARIRAASPARVRPRRQVGPTADYGRG